MIMSYELWVLVHSYCTTAVVFAKLTSYIVHNIILDNIYYITIFSILYNTFLCVMFPGIEDSKRQEKKEKSNLSFSTSTLKATTLKTFLILMIKMSSGQGSEQAGWKENKSGHVKTAPKALSGTRGGCAVLCCVSHDCSKYITHKALRPQLKNRETKKKKRHQQSQQLYLRPFFGSSVGFQSFELSFSKSLFAISCANAQ
jgi:hypothetical protein